MDLDKFIDTGKRLGFEGQELQRFALEREKEVLDREKKGTSTRR